MEKGIINAVPTNSEHSLLFYSLTRVIGTISQPTNAQVECIAMYKIKAFLLVEFLLAIEKFITELRVSVSVR